jgi:hypothetical protein
MQIDLKLIVPSLQPFKFQSCDLFSPFSLIATIFNFGTKFATASFNPAKALMLLHASSYFDPALQYT